MQEWSRVITNQQECSGLFILSIQRKEAHCVFAGNLDHIFTEVLLDAVGLEEDSAPNELSVQVWNNHCLEVDIPVVPAKRFINFPYSWQLSNSIC
jgi:hypothetical protein